MTKILVNRVYQNFTVPMGTICTSLLADLFLYSYEADFIQGLLKDNEKQLSLSLTFTFHNIYNVLSLKKS